MLTLTERAQNRLRESVIDATTPVHITLSPRGCTYPKVTLSAGSPSSDDTTFTVAGFSFLIRKEILDQTGAITLDVMYDDFVVFTQHRYRLAGCGVCPAAAVNGGCCGRSAFGPEVTSSPPQ